MKLNLCPLAWLASKLTKRRMSKLRHFSRVSHSQFPVARDGGIRDFRAHKVNQARYI